MINGHTITPSCSQILNRDPQAFLLVDPTGDDNNIRFTARERGAGGEAISVAYATPAAQATTTVAVSTNAITVTPGTKARMVISGASTTGVNGTLFYAGLYEGFPHWTENGINADTNSVAGIVTTAVIYDGASTWVLARSSTAGTTYLAYSTTGPTYPDAATYDAPIIGTGTPTVTAGISSAAQVLTAVNDDPSASALVSATASGASTGPVAAVTAAFLALP